TVGCAADSSPSAASRALVQDAVHNGGHEGVYFLPPLVQSTTLPPAFDGSLSLTALLEAPNNVLLASEPMSVGASSYQALIDTSGLGLDPTVIYRVRIVDDKRELAFADVKVFLDTKTAKSMATEEFFELVDGKKLRIKVYVNTCGAVDCPASACGA